MLDNNQRGHLLKFQRVGSFNNLVKATGRTSKQCTECKTDIGKEDTKHSVLTYVDQVIVNQVNFPVFKKEVVDGLSIETLHRKYWTWTDWICLV